MTSYEPPTIQVLGNIDELTAGNGKPAGSADQFAGSVPQSDATP